jgi:hypothetical protein
MSCPWPDSPIPLLLTINTLPQVPPEPETATPLGSPLGPRREATAGSYGGGGSYAQGIPVPQVAPEPVLSVVGGKQGRPGSPGCHEKLEERMVNFNLLT